MAGELSIELFELQTLYLHLLKKQVHFYVTIINYFKKVNNIIISKLVLIFMLNIKWNDVSVSMQRNMYIRNSPLHMNIIGNAEVIQIIPQWQQKQSLIIVIIMFI
jgi:hypothetical protein